MGLLRWENDSPRRQQGWGTRLALRTTSRGSRPSPPAAGDAAPGRPAPARLSFTWGSRPRRCVQGGLTPCGGSRTSDASENFDSKGPYGLPCESTLRPIPFAPFHRRGPSLARSRGAAGVLAHSVRRRSAPATACVGSRLHHVAEPRRRGRRVCGVGVVAGPGRPGARLTRTGDPAQPGSEGLSRGPRPTRPRAPGSGKHRREAGPAGGAGVTDGPCPPPRPHRGA